MIAKTQIIEGVVAEYNGKFWGVEYSDGYGETKNFTDIENADICDAKYCTKATDMSNRNTYDDLKKARLRKVKVTKIYEILD